MLFYINGKFVRQDEAHISVLDLAVLRGYAVFDSIRTYQGRPFHLDDHLYRLQYSATELGLSLPNTLDEIKAIIAHLLERNPHPESAIKILVSGGLSADHFTPAAQSSIILFNAPLQPYPAHFYTQGVSVVTTRHSRSLPHIKTVQYAPAICALQQAKAQQPQEALYVNAQEEILEGTISNFFAVKQGTLYTCASRQILHGVTRGLVLRCAKGQIPIEQRPIHCDEIPHLDEAFLTSTTREIQPISAIDHHPIGRGGIGPITQALLSQFRAYTQLLLWPPIWDRQGIPLSDRLELK